MYLTVAKDGPLSLVSVDLFSSSVLSEIMGILNKILIIYQPEHSVFHRTRENVCFVTSRTSLLSDWTQAADGLADVDHARQLVSDKDRNILSF